MEFTDNEINNFVVNQDVRETKKKDPRPIVPERVVPCQGKTIPMSQTVSDILKQDEEVVNTLFNSELEGLTQGDDYTIEYEVDENENIITMCYRFVNDVPETKAKVTLQSPDALFNAKPDFSLLGGFGFGRRALQSVNNGNAPVIQAFELEFNVQGRRAPSDAAIDTFKTFGIIFLIGLFGFLIFGLFVTVLKLTIAPRLNFSQLLIFGFMLRFITKIPFINVNYGNLLVNFMDQIIHLDLQLMINVRNEAGIRTPMAGKFEEYTIPVLFVNSCLITTSVYFVSSILNYVAIYGMDNKNSKFAAWLRNLHYAVLAYTVLDMVTYHLTSLTEHTLSNGVAYWWAISLLIILMVASDLTHIGIQAYNSLISVKALNGNKINIFKFRNPISELAKYQIEPKKAGQDTLSVFLNFMVVGKIILYTTLFTLIQSWPKALMWILTLTQLTFTIWTIVTHYSLGYINNGFAKFIRLIIETLMFLVFVIFLIFAYDPTNMRYMSPTTEGFQWTALFLIMGMIGLECFLFLYDTLLALTEKHKTDEFEVVTTDKDGKMKKTMTYKVSDDDDEHHNPSGANSRKIQTYSRVRSAKRAPSPSANQNDNGYTQPAPLPAGNDEYDVKADFDEGASAKPVSNKPSVHKIDKEQVSVNNAIDQGVSPGGSGAEN